MEILSFGIDVNDSAASEHGAVFAAAKKKTDNHPGRIAGRSSRDGRGPAPSGEGPELTQAEHDQRNDADHQDQGILIRQRQEVNDQNHRE